jgi:hypothetical protein
LRDSTPPVGTRGGQVSNFILKADSFFMAGRAGRLPAVGKTLLALFHMERAFINDSMFGRLQ